MRTVTAAEANRQFSRVLLEVAQGETFTVLSRGKPVATISSASPANQQRHTAKALLLARLSAQTATGTRDGTRDELYEPWAVRVALDPCSGLCRRRGRCKSMLQGACVDRRSLPEQWVVTLGEPYRVLTDKARRDPVKARGALLSWADGFEVVDSTWSAFPAAFDLTVDHGLPIWDASILSVAAENRCRLLLSEDLPSGFTWRGVTVVDPFSDSNNPLLANFLAKPQPT